MFTFRQMNNHTPVFIRLKGALLRRKTWLLTGERSTSGRMVFHGVGCCNHCRRHYIWEWAENGAYPRLCDQCVHAIRQLEWGYIDPLDDEIPF